MQEKDRAVTAYRFHFQAEINKKKLVDPVFSKSEDALTEDDRAYMVRELAEIHKAVQGYVDAIDLTKEVKVVNIPVGTVVAQRQNARILLDDKGKVIQGKMEPQWQGRWNAYLKDIALNESSGFGSASSSMTNVVSALSDGKASRAGKQTYAARKQIFYYVAQEPVQGLESTAKAAVTTWDYQVKEQSEDPSAKAQIRATNYLAQGGATQVFIPEVSKMARLTKETDPEKWQEIVKEIAEHRLRRSMRAYKEKVAKASAMDKIESECSVLSDEELLDARSSGSRSSESDVEPPSSP